MPKFVLFLFFIFISCGLKAQTWELGGGLGGAGYMGDLNPKNPLVISGPSISGYVARNFDGYWSLKSSLIMGRISAADSNSTNPQFRERNLSFTTTLFESSLIGEFNFIDYIPEAGRNKFTPYIFLGFAGVSYFPTTVLNGKTYNLRGAQTEGEQKPYAATAFSIPYGAGVKYNIFGKFTLGAEWGYRNPNTNYLDDVSGAYPAKALLHNTVSGQLSDPSGVKTGIYIGTPGSQRGDGGTGDTYFFMQVTIAYTFVTSKCYFH